MNGHFDLRTEPWIRVRELDGSIRELSLIQTLDRAHEIETLAGEVATQDAALLRLLLAIVRRVLGADTATHTDWATWWRAGSLPTDDIHRYLEKFETRFNLLDPQAPFYQVADLRTPKNEMTELARLIVDVPSGHQLFTTRAGPDLHSMSLAEAARWIVHCQGFDASGIKSGAVGDPRVTGGKGYPIGPAWAGQLGLVIPTGRSLFETLLLNVVIGHTISTPDDAPAWERPPATSAPRDHHLLRADPEHIVVPDGPLDALTWQSRRIRLGVADGMAVSVLICNGDRATLRDQFAVEPMTAWRVSEAQRKALRLPPGHRVYMPQTHSIERNVWRGLAATLAEISATGTVGLSPTVEWLAELSEYGVLDSNYPVRLRIVGIEYGSNNSVVTGMIDDALTMRLDALGSPVLRRVAVRGAGMAAESAMCVANLADDVYRYAGASSDTAAGQRASAREEVLHSLNSPYRQWAGRLSPSEGKVSARDEERYLQAWEQTCWITARGHAQDIVERAGTRAWVGRWDDTSKFPLQDADFALRRFHRQLSKYLPNAALRARHSPGSHSGATNASEAPSPAREQQ